MLTGKNSVNESYGGPPEGGSFLMQLLFIALISYIFFIFILEKRDCKNRKNVVNCVLLKNHRI